MLLFPFAASAQEDSLSKELEDLMADGEKEYVIASFKGTRLINMATLEVAGKRTLDFRIAHRFSNINGSGNADAGYMFFGLDGPASMRISLDYSFDGRFQFGIARNNLEKLYEGSLKYRVFRQTTDNKIPVSVTAYTVANVTGLKPKDDPARPHRFDYFSSRMSYTTQLIIGRKFTKSFSLQLLPTYIHYNLVSYAQDKNDVFALGASGRYKITKRMAITGEYIARLNKYSAFNNSDYVNSASIGMDIETGGHVFQVFVTNSFSMNESQFIPYTSSRWKDGEIRLGFNISRAFTL